MPGLNITANISGAGGINKIGSGTVILEGSTSNTYAGSTIVNEGTLLLTSLGVVLTDSSTSTTGGSFTLAFNQLKVFLTAAIPRHCRSNLSSRNASKLAGGWQPARGKCQQRVHCQRRLLADNGLSTGSLPALTVSAAASNTRNNVHAATARMVPGPLTIGSGAGGSGRQQRPSGATGCRQQRHQHQRGRHH